MPIIRFLTRLPAATQVGRLWIRATGQYSHGRIAESQVTIEKVKELRGELPPEFLILLGRIMELRGNAENAIRCFYQGHEKLVKANRFSQDESAYLKCFCALALTRISQNSRWKLNKKIQVDCSSVALNNVPSFTKNIFPMPEHPDWSRANSNLNRK